MDAMVYAIAPVIAAGSLKPDTRREKAAAYKAARKKASGTSFKEEFAVIYEPDTGPPRDQVTYSNPRNRR